MRDQTSHLEDQLRRALRAEADSQPMTLDVATIQSRLVQRRRARFTQRVVLTAAAAVVVAVGAATAFSLANRQQTVGQSTAPSTPVATASPTASPGNSVALPSLPGRDGVVIDAVSGSVQGAPSIVIGTLTAPGEYTIDAVCQGASPMTISGTPTTFSLDSVPCSGAPAATSFVLESGQRSISVEADGRTAWHVVFSLAPETSPSPSATPEPKPHAPSKPCGQPDLSVGHPPFVRLTAPGKDPIRAEFGTTGWNGTFDDVPADVVPGTTISITTGNGLTLAIDGDVCATAWSVDIGPIPTGDLPLLVPQGSLVEAQENPGNSESFAAENHFGLSIVPKGDWLVRAHFRYKDGDASMYWRVKVARLYWPPAKLTAPGGTSQVGAQGCGGGVDLRSGYGGADSCGGIGPAPDGVVSVAAGDTLSLRFSGWTAETRSYTANFYKPAEYHDGEAGAPSTEVTATKLADGITFSPPGNGDWIVTTSVSLRRNGDSLSGVWVFRIHVGP